MEQDINKNREPATHGFTEARRRDVRDVSAERRAYTQCGTEPFDLLGNLQTGSGACSLSHLSCGGGSQSWFISGLGNGPGAVDDHLDRHVRELVIFDDQYGQPIIQPGLYGPRQLDLDQFFRDGRFILSLDLTERNALVGGRRMLGENDSRHHYVNNG